MENRAIFDVDIKASSQLDNSHSPSQARLHIKADGNKAGGWSALRNDFGQWLQVDLGSYTKVTRIATQGRNGYDQWVTKYRIQYSYAGVAFMFYKKAENSSAKVYSYSQLDIHILEYILSKDERLNGHYTFCSIDTQILDVYI